MTLREQLTAALPFALERTHFEGLGRRYEGKVRDNYTTADGRRVLIATDRVSAFDRVLGTLPYKGQMLNRLSAFWFERTRDVAPNHLQRVPDPNVSEAIECEPLPVEFVMRAYITGVTSTSLWTHYSQGERTFCGHRLPEGLRKNQRLDRPILTPSTKAEKGGHDLSVSRAELLSAGAISARDFDAAAALAEALFAFGQQHCAERGLLLVDTKYEFGRSPSGEIVVIDEVHTPDSSRLWYANSYEARFAVGEEPEGFDKEYVRRWLAAEGYRGEGPPPPLPDDLRVEAAFRYAEAFARITGEAFVPDEAEPLGRIRHALGLP
jgi:phosphoribosylaminoimidazole-succinocarboxamide synthase